VSRPLLLRLIDHRQEGRRGLGAAARGDGLHQLVGVVEPELAGHGEPFLGRHLTQEDPGAAEDPQPLEGGEGALEML
jgi:hypothetical protein